MTRDPLVKVARLGLRDRVVLLRLDQPYPAHLRTCWVYQPKQNLKTTA
jgi:hypothetical protein